MSVNKQVWTGRVVDQLAKQADDSWMKLIRDDSDLVENEVIHISKILNRPNVLLNHNGSYPKAQLQDEDIPINLERWDTENTNVKDEELDTVSYPKIDKVTENHRIALHNYRLDRSAFNCAPQTNGAFTPVIAGLAGTPTILNYIKSAKKKCDDMEMDEEGRIMILSSDNLNEIFDLDNKFHDRYYDSIAGKVVARLFGFQIFSTTRTPLYDTTNNTKASFGAVATSSHTKATLFFHKDALFKAIGKTKVYVSKSDNDPIERETVMGLRQRGILRPIMLDFGFGAIIK